MKRGNGFARGKEAQERRAAKKRRAILMRAMPKRLGECKVKKGPLQDRKHMVRVAQQPCLICGLTFVQVHHIRECYPRTMGVRVGDDKTVPLCVMHHAELHMSNNVSFWKRYRIDAKQWARKFYAETRDGALREVGGG